MPIFKKNLFCQKWRPFWIFEFFAKIPKHKNAYISKSLLDRAISTKFLTHRLSLQSSHANFQKKFSRKKWQPFWIFEFFAKLQNIDRAISMKFLTHRVLLQSTHANFQKNFVLPNMAAILNFQIFAQNCKTQKCLYLENRARWSELNKIFDLLGISAE